MMSPLADRSVAATTCWPTLFALWGDGDLNSFSNPAARWCRPPVRLAVALLF
jgi:hypothetical protein